MEGSSPKNTSWGLSPVERDTVLFIACYTQGTTYGHSSLGVPTSTFRTNFFKKPIILSAMPLVQGLTGHVYDT